MKRIALADACREEENDGVESPASELNRYLCVNSLDQSLQKRHPSPSQETTAELEILNLSYPPVSVRKKRCRTRVQRHDSSSPMSLIPSSLKVHELALPVINCSKHPDLNVIEPKTVHELINGAYDSKLDKYIFIDCRFHYEHQAGRLVNSISMTNPDSVEKFLFAPIQNQSQRTALIFYCEFSANRAPKMVRHIRNLDRWMHSESYPELYYPELYIINGGYKNCFESKFDSICVPNRYVRMHDAAYSDECKRCMSQFRISWKGVSCSRLNATQ